VVFNRSILFAIFAAVCYGISSPVSKILLNDISPIFMASLLYLGAGLGMGIVVSIRRLNDKSQTEAKLNKNDSPYIIGMVVLDIIAPIFLMSGLILSSPASVSLLNNFEIVATSLIALIVFKEMVGKRMWLAIALITISTIILSFEDISNFSLSIGSLFVLAACLSWGFENNCTRMLSLKNPLEVVVIKGIGSGSGSLVIAIITRAYSLNIAYILFSLLLGFFAYGLSVYFYILAQRNLGASRTSAYYAFSPFIGVILSFIFFRQAVTLSFIAALIVMAIGTYFAASERHIHIHRHEKIEHDHRHNHNDGHHNHQHEIMVEEHSHLHRHEALEHKHLHLPDLHHNHTH
jgi:drug/metabolite transporter (DMT)-like permease